MDLKLLPKIARKTLEYYFKYRDKPSSFPDIDFGQFKEKRGVFVTLTKKGELRGCIGYPLPIKPLGEAVVENTLNAAFEDPRFPRLQQDELKDLHIEVSVLTVPEEIKVSKPGEYLEKIKIGRDGLIIKKGWNSGLLLPQVPVEQEWNTEEYLGHLCMKAGMPAEAWKERGVKIERFEAIIVGEKK